MFESGLRGKHKLILKLGEKEGIYSRKNWKLATICRTVTKKGKQGVGDNLPVPPPRIWLIPIGLR